MVCPLERHLLLGPFLGDQFFRNRLLKMGAVKPTEEETKALEAAAQAQQEDPNSIYLKAAADNEKSKGVKARVETVKILADTELIRAQSEETRAKTMETLASIDIADQNQAIKLMDQLSGPRPTAQMGEMQGME